MQARSLNDYEERAVTLAYLCGAKIDNLISTYGVCKATIQNNIIGKRSKKWNDPLIEYYRDQDRGMNAGHIFLSGYYNHSSIPKSELVKKNDLDSVFPVVFRPGIESVLQTTALDKYIKPPKSKNIKSLQDPYERLVIAICGDRQAEDIIKKILSKKLDESYKKGEVSLKEIYSDITYTILEKVKQGGLEITNTKRTVIDDFIENLPERHKTVIKMFYGINRDTASTFDEISCTMHRSKGMIRLFRDQALRIMQKRLESKGIGDLLGGLCTEKEASQYLDDAKKRKEIEESERKKYPENIRMDSLKLSVRTTGFLRESGIETIGQLIENCETDMFHYKNFRRKQLIELNQILADLNLTFKGGSSYNKKNEEIAFNNDIEKRRMDSFNLSARTTGFLRGAGIETIGQLIENCETDMFHYNNFGRKQLIELNQILADLNLTFKGGSSYNKK
jgi:hypothetical protein